jgi:hypothetical protein
MRSSRARAFALIEIVGLLPLIAGVFFVGFELITQIVRVQSAEGRLLSDTAMARDLVRRIQADAAAADEAWLQREGDLATVQLHQGTRTLNYRFAGQQVTREEQTDGVTTASYGWRFECTEADAVHERIEASPGLVWVIFNTLSPTLEGRAIEHRLSAAASVGQGRGS